MIKLLGSVVQVFAFVVFAVSAPSSALSLFFSFVALGAPRYAGAPACLFVEFVALGVVACLASRLAFPPLDTPCESR